MPNEGSPHSQTNAQHETFRSSLLSGRLDRALIRRFDEIVEYGLPDGAGIKAMLRHRLGRMAGRSIAWNRILPFAEGLSQAELAGAADEATKEAVLAGRKSVATEEVLSALNARRAMPEAVADIFNDK